MSRRRKKMSTWSYRGMTVRSDSKGQYFVRRDGIDVFTSNRLEDVRAFVDMLVDNSVKKLDVMWFSDHQEPNYGIIFGVRKDEILVKDNVTGNRAYRHISTIYPKNDKNDEIFNHIVSEREKISNSFKEFLSYKDAQHVVIRGLEETLDPLTPEMFTKN